MALHENPRARAKVWAEEIDATQMPANPAARDATPEAGDLEAGD
jgi:hypothetical protein